MEGNKYLKAKQFKIFLQKRKTLIELERKFEEESGIPICGGSGCSVHISGKKNFDKIADAFKIDPVEQFNGGMSYPYESAIYIDGVRIFTIYNKSDTNGIRYDYSASSYRKEFAEILLEEDDKEVALEILKDKHKDNRYSKLKYLNTYSDLKKYLKRHSSDSKNYSRENLESNYLCYKDSFEPLDSDTTWREAKRIRPNEDWTNPLTFTQWVKANI